MNHSELWLNLFYAGLFSIVWGGCLLLFAACFNSESLGLISFVAIAIGIALTIGCYSELN